MLLLDGKSLSQKRLAILKEKIEKQKTKTSQCPGLTVIRVGEDPASKIYVKKKVETCKKIGIYSKEIHLPTDTSEKKLISEVERLNEDKKVHGVLVQLPLPEQIDVNRVLYKVSPSKDVDGFHPVNLGKLVVEEEDGFVACTPLGIMNLLKDYKIPIDGKNAVVIGRSRVVGRPMSILLDQANATVTVVHLHTKDPKEHTRQADILVVATGVKHLVNASHLKDGAVVVDVGIHRNENGKLCGDVDFEDVKEKVSAITPVPGGVGPLTICSLLENTYKSFLQSS